MSYADCTHTIGLADSREPRGSAWRNWLGIGLRLLVRDTRALFDLLATWQQRVAMRHKLRHLDDHILKDIGISRADMEREAAKSFWRA